MECRIWHNSYPPGVPHTIKYPGLPLKDHFIQRVREHPERDYIIYNDFHISYIECNSLACRFANSLMKSKYHKQERIALMIGNLPEYIIALQACLKIGAAIVPTNPRYQTEELCKQFKRTGTSRVIVAELFADKVIEIVQSGHTDIKQVIVIHNSPSGIDERKNILFDWSEMIRNGLECEPDISVYPEDIALLQHTGGTTGIPKASILTNANLEAMAYMTYHWFTPPLKDDFIRCLIPLPLYHIMGFNNNINFNMIGGGTNILVDPPTSENILNNINLHEPNYFTAVPTMLVSLIQHPDTAQSKIHKLKGMMVGGAPLPLEVMKQFEELYGLKIMQGYGLSETITISCTPYFMEQKPGTVGIPYPDTDVRVVDTEDGVSDVPVHTSGELLVKGPQVMSAYWNNPEETEEAFTDGWFHTGDIVVQDEDGYIQIIDRKKDLIISSGFNIFPREIDEIIYEHPAILEACSIGIIHPSRGEAVKVYASLRSGYENTRPEEIIEHCRQHLTGYKVPVEVEFINELPKTAVGKPDRVMMRKMEKKKIMAG